MPPDDTAAQVRNLLAPYLHTRHFRRGALLWREGETTGMLVAITSGRVKIYRLLPTGRAVTIFLFGPGDVFGFLPFLDGGAYPGYAQAIEDVAAEVLPRSSLFQALRADPELALGLIGLLGRRLRAAMDLVQGLSTPGVRNRVAAALLALADEDPRDRAVLRLPVTAQEFAGAIGVAPETFSRAVANLESEGILTRLGPGSYQLLDLSRLRSAASPVDD